MKILMLSAYFPPEVGSAAHLFLELGKEFVRRGHDVTVVTGFPRYNVSRENLPREYRRGIFLKQMISGMKILRTRTFDFPRDIPFLRGVDQILLSIAFLFTGMFRAGRNVDVVLVYSPPLFLGLAAYILKLMKGSVLVLNVQDIFPQSAIDLGLLRNPLLINIFKRVEQYLYGRSQAITVHSEGNRDYIFSRNGAVNRVVVIPNLVDTREIVPGERDNTFRRKHSIDANVFVVSFAGVIGYSQDLDSVVDAAVLLQDKPEILFLVVGGGVGKPDLERKVLGLRLKNLRFLPMLPKEEYIQLLHASDVCLVTLRGQVKTPVVPSKILSIMAAGRPLVASLPLDGDASKLIAEAGCGYCVEPGNPEKLVDAILFLQRNPSTANSFALDGRRYAEQYLSAERCGDIYERLFAELLNQSK
jgi:colanic acid biosynthesis glycosyl transferase WcaI